MGEEKPFIAERAKQVGLDWRADQFPVVFWDLFGEQGHPIRATVAEMGPLLLSRLMDLNDTQEGVINILFHYADQNGLALLDLKDLRALLQELGSNKELQNELRAAYGNVSPASVGAIQRQLLTLENQGGSKFFGEPALALKDLMKVDRDGRGTINLLAADKLMASPQLYATFLLWLLSELFEELPRSATSTSRSWSSSSTRPTSCSTTPRRRWSRRSSRWCASSAPRASASISSPRTRSTCRRPCSPSSATACSTPCVPSRRGTSGR